MKQFVIIVIILATAGWFGRQYFFPQKSVPATPLQNQTPQQPQANSDPAKPPVAETPTKPNIAPLDKSEKSDAVALYQNGRFQEAIQYLQKDLANPELVSLKDRNLAYLAKSYEYVVDLAKAEATWQQLLAEFPRSKFVGDAKYFQAQQAMKQGLESSGKKLLEEAAQNVEQSLGGQKAALDLGNYYYQKGGDQLLEAWHWYSQVLQGDLPGATRKEVKTILDPMIGKIFTSTPEKVPGAVVYKVKKGDSLDKLSKKFKTSIGLIQWVNHKSDPSLIRLNEELTIIENPVWIQVTKSSFFLTVFLENGLYLRSHEVGLGKDDKTPLGIFTINVKQENPVWYNNGRKYAFGDPKNVLGTRWMGFENKPGVTGFGIHGTPEPDSIGKSQSNGCVRMKNQEVEALFEFIPQGTKVVIK